MKKVRVLVVVFMTVLVSGGFYGSSPAGEESGQFQKEKTVATPESPSGEKATVKLKTDPGISVSTPAGEKPEKKEKDEEKEKDKKPEEQAEKKATLAVKKGPGDTIGIDLVNSVPIRGAQFTISGVKMTELRTTERTARFLAKFNENTGIVILVSTAAEEIPPGAGPVLDVIGEKVPGAEVTLSSIKIVDANRALIE